MPRFTKYNKYQNQTITNIKEVKITYRKKNIIQILNIKTSAFKFKI